MDLSVTWHSLPVKGVFQKLNSGPDGLVTNEARRRQSQYGKNTLPVKKPPPIYLIFLSQFLSPLIYVLIFAGIISIIISDFKDAFFIFFVILLNAVIGAYQEWNAEKSAAALRDLIKVFVRVKRDGKVFEISSEELVLGDIVFIESGRKIPADIRLIETKNLLIDESFLTGESIAAEKNNALLDEKTTVADRSNMAFAGAATVTGRGMGIVVATGAMTEIGMISRSIDSMESTKPPLIIRMDLFSRQISYVVLFICSIIGIFLVLTGTSIFETFMVVVALAVSAIPEGLPAALTVALSVAAFRMSKRNVIARKLTAVESLGSCTVIASDKTGTLTLNEQTVKMLVLPSGQSFFVTGQGYSGEGKVEKQGKENITEEEMAQLLALARFGILANEAVLVIEEGKWRRSGDAMDAALLALGYKLGIDPQDVKHKVEIIREVPYESENKFSALFYSDQGNKKIAVKGAVETVLEFCSAIDPDEKSRIEDQAINLSGKGYRILAVAEGRFSENPDPGTDIGKLGIKGLKLLGLVAFIDPLRPQVQSAVQKCKRAGVEVVMITGDHPATALAIARELGIAESAKDIMTGEKLDSIRSLNEKEYIDKIKTIRVFARVTPAQKLLIVEALIAAGHFVAVTGDGVNDAPALKKAHIGVAMGSGTDVAKDSGSMIIVDDNFASIVAGIEEGRFAYDNVRKVTYLLISTGLAELIMIGMAVLFGVGIPLIAVQLLWLNLVTNGIQDVALAFEGGELETMTRPARKPSEGIFNQLMTQQVLVSAIVMAILSFSFWIYLLKSNVGQAQARNLVLLLMVLLENVHIFNCRSECVSAFNVPLRRNVFLMVGIGLALGLHLFCMNNSFMQKVLNVYPVDIRQFASILFIALVLLLAMELFKRRRVVR